MTKTHYTRMTFDQLPIGTMFSTVREPACWLKVSTRTARLNGNGKVFFFRKNEGTFVDSAHLAEMMAPKPAPTASKPPPFHYHPAYGLPDETRLDILAYADKHSVKDAALVYRVSEGCIYKWRKALQAAEPQALKEGV